MVIAICVGSSCHLRGSERIVELFREAVEKYNLELDIQLMGSFCFGECNRVGVTIKVDDNVYPGITPEGFQTFFEDKVLKVLKK